MTAPSVLNDRCAGAYLVAALRSDVEAMLVLLLEVAEAGGTRALVDFVDALGAVARDLVEQLGTDRVEDLLTRRLLAAATENANHHPKRSNTTVATTTIKALAERHNELNDQLATLLSQHADITRDLQLAGQDWQTALRRGPYPQLNTST